MAEVRQLVTKLCKEAAETPVVVPNGRFLEGFLLHLETVGEEPKRRRGEEIELIAAARNEREVGGIFGGFAKQRGVGRLQDTGGLCDQSGGRRGVCGA